MLMCFLVTTIQYKIYNDVTIQVAIHLHSEHVLQITLEVGY